MDKIVLGVLLVISLAHGLASWFSWYYTIWWLDIPMHIAGGFWVALLFFYLFRDRTKGFLPSSGFLTTIFFSLGFVALVGVGWEFYEYLGEVFVVKAIPFGGSEAGLHFEILKDLFDDLLGGFIATCLVYRLRKKE
ncbi:MAG: hypothetical protein AAB495_01760 [Patescibacteria group bacterium]